MKYLSPIILLLLVGCSNSTPPSGTDSMQWNQSVSYTHLTLPTSV